VACLETNDFGLLFSYVGTDTALAFFRAGYTVRGTVRSTAKATEWIAQFPEYKQRFESAVVPDIAASGAFDEAVKGVDYVAHSELSMQAVCYLCSSSFDIAASPYHFEIKVRFCL
jgi:nucleoside-diphosphate-sugar epimerase